MMGTKLGQTISQFSWRRMWAVLYIHTAIQRRGPFRLMEMFYWPILELVGWGLLSAYLQRQDAQLAGGVTVLLGAVLLWSILFRTQGEMNILGLIDMWEQHTPNMWATPLSQLEYLLAAFVFSLARVAIGSAALVGVAWLGFGYDIATAGLVLPAAILTLVICGWTIGLLIRSAVLRFGLQLEVLAWSIAILLQPVSAVFFPLDVLPPVLQVVARCLPMAHVFEALRAFMDRDVVDVGQLVIGLALSLGYLALSAWIVGRAFNVARKRGRLVRTAH